MSERNITVSVKTDTYEDIRKIAFDDKRSIKDVINEYLADGVRKSKGQTKLD